MIILREDKGSALSHSEMDNNLKELRDGVALMVPKEKTYGIKLDSQGTPGFGWHDLQCGIHVPDYTAPNAPTLTTFVGGIIQPEYEVNDECQIFAHMPHDYLMGSDVFIHVHWSHNSALVTGGSVTFGWELTYAKGHGQGAFGTPITVVEFQNANTTQRQHMICEAPISISGGSANLLDTDDIEVDGILFGRFYISSNDLTVSAGGLPGIFVHEIDIHYQSTGVPTKQRAPDFWT